MAAEFAAFRRCDGYPKHTSERTLTYAEEKQHNPSSRRFWTKSRSRAGKEEQWHKSTANKPAE